MSFQKDENEKNWDEKVTWSCSWILRQQCSSYFWCVVSYLAPEVSDLTKESC